MGAVALIVVLGGMVIPIVVLLGTLLFDLGVVSWAGYRYLHERRHPHLNHSLPTGGGLPGKIK